MSTTIIRIDDRKFRLANQAEGSSVHADIVAAPTRAVKDSSTEFHALGEQRWQEYQRTGEYLDYDDFKAYTLGIARGEALSKPPVLTTSAYPTSQ